MKRYAIFVIKDTYEPEGGWHEFDTFCDTIEIADAYVETKLKKEADFLFEVQIVDLKYGTLRRKIHVNTWIREQMSQELAQEIMKIQNKLGRDLTLDEIEKLRYENIAPTK